MVYIQPVQDQNGKWYPIDIRSNKNFAKKLIWFGGGFETKEDCEIAISDYLSFGCTNDYSDKMGGN